MSGDRDLTRIYKSVSLEEALLVTIEISSSRRSKEVWVYPFISTASAGYRKTLSDHKLS